MSIMIKDMEMPKTCKECPFSDHEAWCLIPGDWRERYYIPKDERSKYCPLIELPPHGRLIDADKLMKKIKDAEYKFIVTGKKYANSFLNNAGRICVEWWCVEDMVENVPTVIEAEDEE